MSVIRAKSLVKRFGELTAVNSIDFAVEHSECFGFLGSNGAGKTSTMRMISCVSPATSGELFVDDLDVMTSGRRIKAALGVVPQEDNLDEDLTVLGNLLVHARYFELPKHEREERSKEALEFMGLASRAGSAIDTLSGGMKRRLLIARALLNRPRVLILDEPTTGLDPHARHLVWQRLIQLKAQGTTMVLSTHYMDEAAYLCDRIAIMGEGVILTMGTPAELVKEHMGDEVLELRLAPWDKEKAMAHLEGKVDSIADAGDALILSGLNGWSLDPELGLDPQHTSVVQRPPNLEDLFLRLTGKGLEDE